MDVPKDKLRERAHLVEGLLRVVDDRVAFLFLVERSADRYAAKNALVTEWGLSEVQASNALDLTFGRMTQLGRSSLAEELAELRARIGEGPT